MALTLIYATFSIVTYLEIESEYGTHRIRIKYIIKSVNNKIEDETYGMRPACSWRRRNSWRSFSSWICLRSSSNFFCSASCFCSAFHTFSMFRRLPVCHPFLFKNFNAMSLAEFQIGAQIFSNRRCGFVWKNPIFRLGIGLSPPPQLLARQFLAH